MFCASDLIAADDALDIMLQLIFFPFFVFLTNSKKLLVIIFIRHRSHVHEQKLERKLILKTDA